MNDRLADSLALGDLHRPGRFPRVLAPQPRRRPLSASGAVLRAISARQRVDPLHLPPVKQVRP